MSNDPKGRTTPDHGTRSDSAPKHVIPKQSGRVYSYEYHEPRAKRLSAELLNHQLSGYVHLTHRDVYTHGFCNPICYPNGPTVARSPNATKVFLDLPSPWLALRHLTRTPPSAATLSYVAQLVVPTAPPPELPDPFVSPLHPTRPVHLCVFLPCIEQIQKLVPVLRLLGWVEISMSTMRHKNLEVRRERIGLQEEGIRGGNPAPASVDEALQRLLDVEGRAKIFHALQVDRQEQIKRRAEARKRGEKVPSGDEVDSDDCQDDTTACESNIPASRTDRLERVRANAASRDLFKEGRLHHRTAPEIKTHTSYLVFATLPQDWDAHDEEQMKGGSCGKA